MSPYVCTNCGFWQRGFAVPASCPVCLDFRHTPAENGFEFWSAREAAERIATVWREDENGVLIFHSEPALGIGPSGYLLALPGGNLLFENPAWYSEAALDTIAARGGVRWLAASHPHAYGGLWQAQERFEPETVAIQREDLAWTNAFRVNRPYDEFLKLAPGVELHHTGGHFDGHAVLYWRDRRTLFAGDTVKFHLGENPPGISTHKGFNRHIPMSHAEIRRYRDVVEPLEFDETYTTFEHAPRGVGTRAAVLDLFRAQLRGAPFFGPMPLSSAPEADGRSSIDAPESSDAVALSAYRAVYAPALAAGARSFEFSQTPLDRLDLPLWTVACVDADGTLSDGFGYGPTLAAARASAWGEAVEWHLAREWFRHAPRTRGTFSALRADGEPVLDPVSLCLSAGSRYSHDDNTLEWVEARRHPTGEAVLVPVEFVAPRFADLGPGFDRAAALAVPITNGLGAGLTRSHALAHGVLELLQRDGNSVHYRALDRGLLVDLGEDHGQVRDPRTRALLQTLDAAGVEILVKLADDSFGLTNLYVVGYDRDPTRAPQAISLSACGEAVHPDRERALAKALREFVSARARKAFNHGPLAPVRAVSPPGYLEAFGPASLRNEDDRALSEMQRWMRLDHAAYFEEIRHPLFDVRARLRFDALPTTAVPDSDALLALLTERLAQAGLEIYHVDFMPPGSPAVALKAIVPGLEVETMTYQRIGARNLRRLLSRGSPLVGVGDRQRPAGALPIRLPPAAAATFDGEPWFDPAALGRTVGPLYPLYREPGRHMAALLEEQARANR